MMRRSRKTRAAVTIGIVGVLAAAVYLTKPGPGTVAVDGDSAAERGSLTGSDGDRRDRETPAEEEREGNLAGADGGSQTPESEDISTTPPSARHGEDAVVRAGENLGGKIDRKRLTGTPDWSSPASLGFGDFKKLRRQFRRAGDFTPDELSRLHGAAVIVRGALMPIDPVPESGKLERFWLANPIVVMAGCVFCNPPTMADLVYVRTNGAPLKVDRERLYRSVVYAKLLGRFELGPGKSEDGVEYMFGMDLEERKE